MVARAGASAPSSFHAANPAHVGEPLAPPARPRRLSLRPSRTVLQNAASAFQPLSALWAIWVHLRLKIYEKALLTLLILLADNLTGRVWDKDQKYTYRYLATLLGCSSSTVKRALAGLETVGLVATERQRRGPAPADEGPKRYRVLQGPLVALYRVHRPAAAPAPAPLGSPGPTPSSVGTPPGSVGPTLISAFELPDLPVRDPDPEPTHAGFQRAVESDPETPLPPPPAPQAAPAPETPTSFEPSDPKVAAGMALILACTRAAPSLHRIADPRLARNVAVGLGVGVRIPLVLARLALNQLAGKASDAEAVGDPWPLAVLRGRLRSFIACARPEGGRRRQDEDPCRESQPGPAKTKPLPRTTATPEADPTPSVAVAPMHYAQGWAMVMDGLARPRASSGHQRVAV